MLELDEKALNDRFKETVLSYTSSGGQVVVVPANQRLLQNQPKTNVDETKPWVRFSISPGASGQSTTGTNPSYTQVGTAYLQVFAPLGSGMGAARQIRDKFVAAFRGWKSDDGYTYVDGIDINTIDQTGYTQINVAVSWVSQRRPN